ncbi:MAG: TIGR02206 family membrane protein [Phycisphaerales bacterium]
MNGAAPDWTVHFTPYSATHLIVLVVFACWTVGVCFTASRLRPGEKSRMDRVIATVGLAISGLYGLWWLLPGHFDIERSLPLHVCDVMSFVSPLSLLVRSRALRAIAVFLGLAFCTQAFIKPLSGAGPMHPQMWGQFWGFWLTHGLVVFIAIYWVWAHGFRPTMRDLRVASAAAWVYVIGVFLLDAAFHLNYGYVGRGTATGETMADQLGPWPLRVVWITLIAQGGLIGVMLLRLIPGGERRSEVS